MASPSALQKVSQIYEEILGYGSQVQDFIKDELPSNAGAGSKWGQDVLRRGCRKFARATVSGVGEVWSPIWGNVCDPYLDSINEGPESQGDYGPEWDGAGGQCDGKLYGSSITFRTGFIDVDGNTVWGPVQTSNADCGVPGVNLTGPVSFSVTTSGSQRFYQFLGKNNTFGASVSVSTSAPFQLFGTSLTLCSGQGTEAGCPLPDNQYKPPRYPTDLPVLPPVAEPAPGLGDGWDVTINPDGSFKVCWGEDECTPDMNPDGSGGDPSEDPGEEDGDPQENDPNNPQDGDITGCASEGQILTGIKIEITQTPPAEVPGAGGLYRKVCWVWMGPSQDQLDLVTDGRYLESGQFVIPDSNNCRCYKVRPSPLWGLRVQAFSRPEKED